MILPVLLLINNIILFFLETIGYQLCHSVVILLDGYFHLCQAILCTVRIVSQLLKFTFTSRQTYGLARIGVVGELVAFVSFFSLSISVFLESIKHIFDVIWVARKQENQTTITFPSEHDEHSHGLVARPQFILGIGIYATLSNFLVVLAMFYVIFKRSTRIKNHLQQRRPSLKQPLPKQLISSSLLITDTLPVNQSYLQIFNMLLGPIVILICGTLLIVLSEKDRIRDVYSRLVDPIICCVLFLIYLFVILNPMKEVVRLVLQANPCNLKLDQVEKLLCDSVQGVISIHELHIWRLSPQTTLATVHIVFNTTDDIQTKYEDIHYVFQTLEIDHVTIQPEFSLPSDEIAKLGCHYQCSVNNTECRPLQCCQTSN